LCLEIPFKEAPMKVFFGSFGLGSDIIS
jgi:hypothetical protein